MFYAPLVLLIGIHLIARRHSDYSIVTNVLITGVISVANIVLMPFFAPAMGPWVLLPMFFIAAYLVIRLCNVSFAPGALVVFLYLVVDARWGTLKTLLYTAAAPK